MPMISLDSIVNTYPTLVNNFPWTLRKLRLNLLFSWKKKTAHIKHMKMYFQIHFISNFQIVKYRYKIKKFSIIKKFDLVCITTINILTSTASSLSRSSSSLSSVFPSELVPSGETQISIRWPWWGFCGVNFLIFSLSSSFFCSTAKTYSKIV